MSKQVSWKPPFHQKVTAQEQTIGEPDAEIRQDQMSLSTMQKAPKNLCRSLCLKSKDCLVFHGSNKVKHPTTKRPLDIPTKHWKPLVIARGDLMVVNTTNVNVGMQYHEPAKSKNPYIIVCLPSWCPLIPMCETLQDSTTMQQQREP